jgi:hypothetical protein
MHNVGHPVAVGSYPAGASPYGALDMVGNVYEWGTDWYADDYYARSPARNPQGPDSGTARVYRGGAFDGGRAQVRSTFRNGRDPNLGGSTIGFRVAMDTTASSSTAAVTARPSAGSAEATNATMLPTRSPGSPTARCQASPPPWALVILPWQPCTFPCLGQSYLIPIAYPSAMLFW